MKPLLCAALLAGCGFSATVPGAGPGDDDDPLAPDAGDATGPQPPTVVPPSCTDPAMRLCIDFEELAPVHDEASGSLGAQNLTAATRAIEQAARFATSSWVHVQERAGLDISPNITLELWVKPRARPDEGAMVLLENALQYGIEYEADGELQCALAGARIDSAAISANAWHHVACTYDGAELRIYVDGHLAGCQARVATIERNAILGTVIGARLAGLLSYRDHFDGELDDVHVFARTFSAREICGLASPGGTCNAACPESHDD